MSINGLLGCSLMPRLRLNSFCSSQIKSFSRALPTANHTQKGAINNVPSRAILLRFTGLSRPKRGKCKLPFEIQYFLKRTETNKVMKNLIIKPPLTNNLNYVQVKVENKSVKYNYFICNVFTILIKHSALHFCVQMCNIH